MDSANIAHLEALVPNQWQIGKETYDRCRDGRQYPEDKEEASHHQGDSVWTQSERGSHVAALAT